MDPMPRKPEAEPGGRRTGLAGTAALAFSLVPWLPLTVAAQPLPAGVAVPSASGVRLGGGGSGSTVLPGYQGFGALGGLGYPFGAAPFATAPGEQPRAWTIVPSIGLQLVGTDNVDNTATNRRSDLITTVTPSLAFEANSARLTGRLFYAPTGLLYANSPEYNGFNQNFSGQLLGTLVEDALFLDLRGFAGVQSAGGGYASSAAPVTNRSDQVQNYTFQVAPYFTHRFGGLATLQVGYTFGYSNQDGAAASLANSPQPFFTSQETISNEGYLVVRSGEDFGRFGFEGRVTGVTYDSNGVLDGAHRFVAELLGRYAVTREVAVLLGGGYEDLSYGGTAPTDLSKPIWTVGVRIAPNPDSLIIVTYGYRDGFYAPYVSGNFAIGVRTRVFGTYSERLGNSTVQIGNDLLSALTVDALGNLVDGTTGAALPGIVGNPLLAPQNSISRIKTGSIGISQSWERDTISLTGYYSDTVPVTSQPGTVGFAQKGYTVGLSWARELTPHLTGVASASYGRTESAGAGNGENYTASLALSQELAPGLFGTLQYIYRASNGGLTPTARGFTSGDVTQNMAIFGLRQSF
jgi:uncharacterized protein (PEP-CTERM system associated)